jgi:hypothetical protein
MIIIQTHDGSWQLIYVVDVSVAEALASEYAWIGSVG